MRRREFIAGLSSTAAAACPLGARAQQDGRVRQIGILTRSDETDRRIQSELVALREGLARLGWIEGRNVEFDVRYSDDDPDRLRAHVDDLVRLAPDVIVVSSWPTTRLRLLRTRTIPIGFMHVGYSVAGGLLQNIALPEGNATGITSVDQSMGGKWLELLKEVAPRTTQVALVFVPGLVTENYFAAID